MVIWSCRTITREDSDNHESHFDMNKRKCNNKISMSHFTFLEIHYRCERKEKSRTENKVRIEIQHVTTRNSLMYKGDSRNDTTGFGCNYTSIIRCELKQAAKVG